MKTVTQPPKSFVHSKLLCFPSCFCRKFFVGNINAEHTASTSSPYTHANIVHIRARMVRKQPYVHSTIIGCTLVYFFFRVDFRVDFGCNTAFIIVHMHVLWLAVHWKLAQTNKPTNQPTIIVINNKDIQRILQRIIKIIIFVFIPHIFELRLEFWQASASYTGI